jgi:membrane-associated phospholipid phosphatase
VRVRGDTWPFQRGKGRGKVHVLAFVRRHLWSLSLTLLSALAFGRLAHQMREGHMEPFDQRVSAWLQSTRGVWDTPMLLLTRFGAFWSLSLLHTAVVVALWWCGRRWESAYVAACGLGSGLLCTALKLLFQRVRPNEQSLYLISTPSSFSFPSGHAMGAAGVLGSFVLLVFAMRVRRRWRVLSLVVGLLLIVGVGLSRIYFGVHYPSDVLAGQAAAAAWIAAVTGWFFPRLLPSEGATSGGG